MDTIDKINVILLEKKMTGAELSRLIGVSTGVYSQWNKKKTHPTKKNLEKIAAALGVTVGELLPAEKENPPTEADGRRGEVMRLWDALDVQTQDHFFALLQAAAKQ